MTSVAGESTCIWCAVEIDDGELFCGRNCISQAEQRAPLLIQIPKSHKKYTTGEDFNFTSCSLLPPPIPLPLLLFLGLLAHSSLVREQFNKSWRHPTKRPQVKHVYKIIYSANLMRAYTTYRSEVETRVGTPAGGGPGNEQRRFHGTKRACLVGDKGNTTLCTSDQCSLCRIIRGSYDIKYYKNNTSYGRYVNDLTYQNYIQITRPAHSNI
jgi:hypothetical protein